MADQQNAQTSAAASSVSSSASPAAAVGTQLDRTSAVKAAGGGLEAGTTDFGSTTSPISGSSRGVGSGAARSTGSGSISSAGHAGGDGAPADAPGMTSAAGLDVMATGRPADPEGGPVGAAAVSGGPVGETVSQVSPTHQRTGGAADVTTGTAGAGTSGRRARPADLTNDRATAPNLIGPGPSPDSPQSLGDQLKKATADARKAMEPG